MMRSVKKIPASPCDGSLDERSAFFDFDTERSGPKRRMTATEASTPIKRAYYAAQLCIAGEINSWEGRLILEGALADIVARLAGRKEAAELQWAAEELREGRLYLYGVMRCLAAALDLELEDDLSNQSLLDEWRRWRNLASERRQKEAATENSEDKIWQAG